MPEELWSGPRRRNWAKVRIPPHVSWWKPASACMRREWRPPYDPLLCAPRRTRFADVVWRFHSSVPAVSGSSRRFPERDEDELADIPGDHHLAACSLRSGPTAAGALLAVAQVFRQGRFRIFIRL